MLSIVRLSRCLRDGLGTKSLVPASLNTSKQALKLVVFGRLFLPLAWLRMLKPSLAKSLVLLFVLLVMLESFFLGLISFDVLNVENQAQKEMKAINVSLGMYQAMHEWVDVQRAFDAADDAVAENSPRAAEKLAYAEKKDQEFRKGLVEKEKQVFDVVGDRRLMVQLQDSAFHFLEQNRLKNHPTADTNLQDLEMDHLKAGKECVKLLALQIMQIRKKVASAPPPHPLGLTPTTVVNIAVATNLIYMLLFAIYIRRAISLPLGRLADSCEKLRLHEKLEKMPVSKTEIGALQQSFQDMSEQVMQNEMQRSSYLQILQSVQSAALSRVKSSFEQLIAMSNCSDKAKQRITRAKNNVDSLLTLLQSMTEQLASSRQSAPKMQIGTCKVSSLVQEVASSVESLLQQRKIRLEVTQVDFDVNVDRALISRVLLNLVSNAIKYSPEGGVVRISLSNEKSVFRFAVKDDGPGISEEGRSKLFKRYQQLEALDGVKRSGTGLGLVIAKEFVELHGGKISCDSTPGQGSQFCFEIPQNKARLQKTSDAQLSQTKTETGDSKKRKNNHANSILSRFAFTLIIFLCTQIFLFFQLNVLLKQSADKATVYVLRKQECLETEELYAKFCYFGRIVEIAARTQDLGSAKTSVKFLQEHLKQLASFHKIIPKDDPIFNILKVVRSRESYLFKGLSHFLDDPQSVLSHVNDFAKEVAELATKIANDLIRVMDFAVDEVRLTFESTRDLRNDILFMLGMSAVFDLLIISAASYIGLNMAGKILILKSKAETFAAGKEIAPSIKGNDELSFLDQRLCLAAQDILDAAAEKKELLAIINHDLRTPLASILGTTQMLSQGVLGPLPAHEAQISQKTERELTYLLQQINDLLLMEKIESGSYSVASEELDLREVINMVSAELKPFGEEKGLRLRVDTQPDKIKLVCDRQLLTRLLGIVLQNAIAASQKQGQISVIVRLNTEAVDINVVNSGATIDPSLRSVIFERFRYVNGSAITGFGLPLASRICKIQNASIDLQSEGDRTTAHICIGLTNSPVK